MGPPVGFQPDHPDVSARRLISRRSSLWPQSGSLKRRETNVSALCGVLNVTEKPPVFVSRAKEQKTWLTGREGAFANEFPEGFLWIAPPFRCPKNPQRLCKALPACVCHVGTTAWSRPSLSSSLLEILNPFCHVL